MEGGFGFFLLSFSFPLCEISYIDMFDAFVGCC